MRMYYPIFIDESMLRYRIPEMFWDDVNEKWILEEEPREKETILFPIDEQGQHRRWKWSIERLTDSPTEVKLDKDRSGQLSLYIKARQPEGVTPPTWWAKKEYSATDWGTREVKNLFGRFGDFDYPKAVGLVEDSIRVISPRSDDKIFDYFAGSGTTGHAVINLNREDGGNRKFILVEMAEYFDTVLLPRIKKVTFSPEWRNGKPRRMATPEEAKNSPRIVKVIRLESYEDSLNNITFDESAEQQTLQFDDYLLQYMLKWETRKSETLLNVKKMDNPFSYELYIHCNNDEAGGKTKSKVVDLPETFAYLLGLAVEKRLVLYDDDRRYLVHKGTTRNGRNTIVIWRTTEGWTEEDYKRER
ncbi:MAG: hypothetical protein GX996_01575 [Firmicutes bacterium]|nr:hypothetical protein [Bacillota bacterium]